jgi:DNA repair protein RecO (recombination protein O)
MALEKTEAIVLKQSKLRETSLIVTHFTRDFGKLKTVCKGVRQERSSLFLHFEPFVHLDLVLYKKDRSELHLLKESSCIHDFQWIREDFTTWTLASYFVDFVEEIMPLEELHPEVFDLLLAALEGLKSEHSIALVRSFEIKLLSLSGLWPHLDHCVVCQKSESEDFQFSSSQGGLVCSSPACLKRAADHRALSKGSVATLRFISSHSFQEAVKLNISGSIAKELEHLIRDFVIYHVGRELKAAHFLGEVRETLEIR